MFDPGGAPRFARGVVPRHFGLVYLERKELEPKGSVQASSG